MNALFSKVYVCGYFWSVETYPSWVSALATRWYLPFHYSDPHANLLFLSVLIKKLCKDHVVLTLSEMSVVVFDHCRPWDSYMALRLFTLRRLYMEDSGKALNSVTWKINLQGVVILCSILAIPTADTWFWLPSVKLSMMGATSLIVFHLVETLDSRLVYPLCLVLIAPMLCHLGSEFRLQFMYALWRVFYLLVLFSGS